MPLGNGYWYDRLRRRYIEIDDHWVDALANPKRYRLSPSAVKTIGRIRNKASAREVCIAHVAACGFIRVRHWKRDLAWQFYGDPDGALKALARYCVRHEVGLATSITFSDLALRHDDCFLTALGGPKAADLVKVWETFPRVKVMLRRWRTRDVAVR